MRSRVIVFDVDDTLYPEIDFVKSGFREVAAHCEARTGVAESRTFNLLWDGFQRGVRGDAFNRLMAREPILGETVTVEELVGIYRGHSPSITMRRGMRTLIRRLGSAGHRLAVITDGDPGVQRRKLAALRVPKDWFVVVTGELGAGQWKPDPAGYLAIERWSLRESRDHVYIADNPAKDFLVPRARGWLGVRLRLPDQLHHHAEPATTSAEPDSEVRSVAELARLLLHDRPDTE